MNENKQNLEENIKNLIKNRRIIVDNKSLILNDAFVSNLFDAIFIICSSNEKNGHQIVDVLIEFFKNTRCFYIENINNKDVNMMLIDQLISKSIKQKQFTLKFYLVLYHIFKTYADPKNHKLFKDSDVNYDEMNILINKEDPEFIFKINEQNQHEEFLTILRKYKESKSLKEVSHFKNNYIFEVLLTIENLAKCYLKDDNGRDEFLNKINKETIDYCLFDLNILKNRSSYHQPYALTTLSLFFPSSGSNHLNTSFGKAFLIYCREYGFNETKKFLANRTLETMKLQIIKSQKERDVYQEKLKKLQNINKVERPKLEDLIGSIEFVSKSINGKINESINIVCMTCHENQTTSNIVHDLIQFFQETDCFAKINDTLIDLISISIKEKTHMIVFNIYLALYFILMTNLNKLFNDDHSFKYIILEILINEKANFIFENQQQNKPKDEIEIEKMRNNKDFLKTLSIDGNAHIFGVLDDYEIFTKLGLDPLDDEAEDTNVKTFLHIASEMGNRELVEFCIKKTQRSETFKETFDICMRTKDKSKTTPVGYSVQNVEIFQLFFGYFEDLSFLEFLGENFLDCENLHIETIVFFLKKAAHSIQEQNFEKYFEIIKQSKSFLKILFETRSTEIDDFTRVSDLLIDIGGFNEQGKYDISTSTQSYSLFEILFFEQNCLEIFLYSADEITIKKIDYMFEKKKYFNFFKSFLKKFLMLCNKNKNIINFKNPIFNAIKKYLQAAGDKLEFADINQINLLASLTIDFDDEQRIKNILETNDSKSIKLELEKLRNSPQNYQKYTEIAFEIENRQNITRDQLIELILKQLQSDFVEIKNEPKEEKKPEYEKFLEDSERNRLISSIFTFIIERYFLEMFEKNCFESIKFLLEKFNKEFKIGIVLNRLETLPFSKSHLFWVYITQNNMILDLFYKSLKVIVDFYTDMNYAAKNKVCISFENKNDLNILMIVIIHWERDIIFIENIFDLIKKDKKYVKRSFTSTTLCKINTYNNNNYTDLENWILSTKTSSRIIKKIFSFYYKICYKDDIDKNGITLKSDVLLKLFNFKDEELIKILNSLLSINFWKSIDLLIIYCADLRDENFPNLIKMIMNCYIESNPISSDRIDMYNDGKYLSMMMVKNEITLKSFIKLLEFVKIEDSGLIEDVFKRQKHLIDFNEYLEIAIQKNDESLALIILKQLNTIVKANEIYKILSNENFIIEIINYKCKIDYKNFNKLFEKKWWQSIKLILDMCYFSNIGRENKRKKFNFKVINFNLDKINEEIKCDHKIIKKSTNLFDINNQVEIPNVQELCTPNDILLADSHLITGDNNANENTNSVNSKNVDSRNSTKFDHITINLNNEPKKIKTTYSKVDINNQAEIQILQESSTPIIGTDSSNNPKNVNSRNTTLNMCDCFEQCESNFNKILELFLNKTEIKHPLELIIDSDQPDLIDHETTKCVLMLKWRYSRLLYWADLFFYTIFLILFTFCLKKKEYYDDEISIDILYLQDMLVSLAIYILLSFFIILELFQMLNEKMYYFDLRNILDLLFYVLCIITLSSNSTKSTDFFSYKSFSIIFGLIIFVFRLEKLSLIGHFVTAFRRAFKKILQLLPLFAIFFIGFFTTFINSSFFEYSGESGIKTLIMTIGEFNINELISMLNQTTKENTFMTKSNYIILVFFVIIMSILLLNLSTGIAVEEISEILKQAYINKLKLRIDFVVEIETLSYRWKFLGWLYKNVMCLDENGYDESDECCCIPIYNRAVKYFKKIAIDKFGTKNKKEISEHFNEIKRDMDTIIMSLNRNIEYREERNLELLRMELNHLELNINKLVKPLENKMKEFDEKLRKNEILDEKLKKIEILEENINNSIQIIDKRIDLLDEKLNKNKLDNILKYKLLIYLTKDNSSKNHPLALQSKASSMQNLNSIDFK